MGALTSNRKGVGDYFINISSPTPFDKSYGHISKKPKLSACMSPNTPQNNRAAAASVVNSVAARIAQYPERKLGFPRTVHAPVSHRFGSLSSVLAAGSRDSPADKMGRFGFFYRNYEKIKDSALRSLRYVGSGKQKEKEVIKIDSSDELDCDHVSKDSSIGKVEIVDFQRRRWKGEEGAAEKEVRSLDSYVITDVSNAVAKVENMETNGLSLMDPAADDSEQPFYKKLHNQANKMDHGLINISLRIDSHEKQIQGLRSLRTTKKEEPIEKDVAEECFVPLTREEKAVVSRALSNSHRKKILVSHANSGIDISGEILQCLRPRAWLNDEVINVYFELLKEREKRVPEKFLNCHFFNTFFYKKLMSGHGGYNFQSVRRWTTQKKLGYSLLECEKIFVPIHQEIHWCLAVVNKKDEKFQYLDPLGGRDSQVLNALAKYFEDEVKDKCGKDINLNTWEKEFVTELPEQLNGFDCGMFMIKYADFYSRDIGLCFSQENMPYFRERTAKELLKLRAD
ncbi:putative ubiquitin-like-specific protease 1B isoform X1 [Salvia splendens]|uniref:putative ubiquitin-like-specific protease 1B isoform X1 n=1 Tax=Salvia splendens TaxID=180675 RepID=UPI001C271B0A|nr:putative ubiquitin-like-specific protease 1B isoform X1 [Salvia splendens]